MKLLRKLLLGAASLFALSSCGMLMGSEESLFIESVLAEEQPDGSTKVTITFTDEDIAPVVFFVPKGDEGEQGPKGTGIASVDSVVSEDGSSLIITMTYTDASLEPSVWTIPNATSIEDIESSYDPETGMTTVTISTNDGEDHTFDLPKGKDGNGIASVRQETLENGDVLITIEYTDENVPNTEIRLPSQSGKDGNGIAYIESFSDEENYYLIIHFTETEEPQTLTFPLPQVEDGTKWFTNSGDPYNIREAKEGDFYFDSLNGAVWRYDDGAWVLQFAMGEAVYYTVTFDAVTNGGRIVEPASFSPTQRVKAGSPLPVLPRAEKEGSTFLGWYTNPYGEESFSATKITDLTPVTKDFTAYACFTEDAS